MESPVVQNGVSLTWDFASAQVGPHVRLSWDSDTPSAGHKCSSSSRLTGTLAGWAAGPAGRLAKCQPWPLTATSYTPPAGLQDQLVVFKTNSIFYTYKKMSLSDSHKHVLKYLEYESVLKTTSWS